jgi:hypothetical protein
VSVGVFGPEAVVAAHAEPSNYWPQLGLVALEQTHNFGGGNVWPLDVYDAVVAPRTSATSRCTSTARG